MKKYSVEHEWVELEGNEVVVGVSEYAANELGDITFIELPDVGRDVIVGDVLMVIESVKAASDIYCPISGTVLKVNDELNDDPAIVNESPEEKGWICKLENFDIAEIDELMDKDKYQDYLKNKVKDKTD